MPMEGRKKPMKMKYEKPTAAVERYELSQAIAGCVTKIGMNGTNSCIRKDDDPPPAMRDAANMGWFADNTCAAGLTPNIGTMYDGVCYHTSNAATFHS